MMHFSFVFQVRELLLKDKNKLIDLMSLMMKKKLVNEDGILDDSAIERYVGMSLEVIIVTHLLLNVSISVTFYLIWFKFYPIHPSCHFSAMNI